MQMESLHLSLVAFSGVLLWLLVLVQVDAQSRVEEVLALTSFEKNVLVGNDYSNTPNWPTWKENDENACAWVGVTCSPNYTVEALDFSNWEFYAVITTFKPLSELRDLRQLDMSFNLLSGPIPDDIGSLTQLSHLDLSDNHFGGSIPSNISACRELQFLSLQNNYISGTIPDLSELVQLRILLLGGNFEISGSFPKELGQMSSLVRVDISGNQLNGTIPSLINATRLQVLNLYDNSFVGFEEPFQINASNLLQLDVSSNLLDGIIPHALFDLPIIWYLNMSFNGLSGTIPAALHFTTLPGLFLDLSHNQLSGSTPADLLPPSHNYSYINLSYNLLNGSIAIFSSSNYTNISAGNLDLSHNHLSGSVPASIIFSFQLIWLEYNFFSGDIVDVLTSPGTYSEGFSFFVGNNYFTGDLSRLAFEWTNWTGLRLLDLNSNNLSWTASESIPDPISAVLYSMPYNFQYFIVGGNNFSGTSLPVAPGLQAKGSLPNLLTLDLSDCQLEGVISGVVFNQMSMPNLTSLNLSHNSATGPVPDNITKLSQLQVLDLSYNMLSGPLPKNLPQNSYLINTSFFDGNEGLCGYPLVSCPQVFPSHGAGVQWWTLLIIICGSIMIATGSCLMVTWRWRVYHKLHEQDADLIRTLMQRELVTLMPLRKLKKATNNFAECERIGEGGFGTVYKGKLRDGTIVAIKRSKREGSEKDKAQFLNEVTILSHVNHRHLVKLMGCCMENKVALLVFEFISNGTLQDHLRGKVADGHLSWKQRLTIAVQTADALNYLHSATSFPIYHRDVKSANILLNNDLSAKVADFGISKLAPAEATHVSTALQGTIGYIDPDYWVSFQLTEKSDVYSFGVVLLELISARPAIDYQRDEEERSLVMFASPYIQSGNLDPLIDPTLIGIYGEQNGHGKESILEVGRLAMRCLEIQSNARPSMNKVWKELQDVCFKFEGTSMQEDLGYVNNDDHVNNLSSDLDHEIPLSPFASTCRSDSFKPFYNEGSLELAHLSS